MQGPDDPVLRANRFATKTISLRRKSTVLWKIDVDRLMFIRHARDLGFTLQAIRDLLSLSEAPEQSCETADKIAQFQLKEIEHRISRLHALKIEMERMIEQCKGGNIADCRIIEVLSNHALCHADKHT